VITLVRHGRRRQDGDFASVERGSSVAKKKDKKKDKKKKK
jgi:hypothetical protein